MNIQNVTVPENLVGLPVWRGLVVPFFIFIDEDAQPNFRVLDPSKHAQALRHNLCGICGNPLGRAKFFAGSENKDGEALYANAASHLDCIVYAMQICPFILGKTDYADPAKLSVKTGIEVHNSNPNAKQISEWFIVKATAYKASPSGYVKAAGKLFNLPGIIPSEMDESQWNTVKAFLRIS